MFPTVFSRGRHEGASGGLEGPREGEYKTRSKDSRVLLH